MKKIFYNYLIRKNIKSLIPYSSARIEFKGKASIFLDANENSYGSPLYACSYNRYPDPFQKKLKNKISKIKNISKKNIFLGNGSDEIIDLIYKIFCRPGIDNSIICEPTYGMYEVSARINEINIIHIPLTKKYQPNIKLINSYITKYSKLIFLCSPNNPTSNNFDLEKINNIINFFPGIIVIDEAYIDFSKKKSFLEKIKKYKNIIIIQTLSKAWGLAGLRIGIAFAYAEIINFFNKIKHPYNISEVSQEIALKALKNKKLFKYRIQLILEERERLYKNLLKFNFIKNIYPSSSNFLFIKFKNSEKIYNYLIKNGVVIRNRSNMIKCKNCLRITIGTVKENNILINKLNNIKF